MIITRFAVFALTVSFLMIGPLLYSSQQGVQSSAVRLVGASPSPGNVTATDNINSTDARQLVKEFQNAQYAEIKALKHRQKLELKELAAALKAKEREWEKNETEARRKFFAHHTKGPERRAYITDLITRKKALRKIHSDERTKQITEHAANLAETKEQQESSLKQFHESLSRGERPPESLWPPIGR